MIKARFEWLEVILIGGGILFPFAVASNPSPPESNFVPNAVTAYTTMAGILTAFIGYWLTHAYSVAIDKKTRKWMNKRIAAVVYVIIIGLMLVMISLSELAYGRLESAYKVASFGTGIILLASCEIMAIIIREKFKEELK